MNVRGLLAVALLCSACSDRAVVDQAAPQSAVSPEPGSAPTTGAPAPESAAAPAPPSNPQPSASEPQKDVRAAKTGAVTVAAQQAGVNADGAILADFNARVQKYVDVHKSAAKGDAKLKQTENPSEILAAQEILASRIRTARADAKHGDIFTPEIRNVFRKLLAPETKGEDGRDAKAVLKEDAPSPGSIPFKVHAKYPEGAPLPSVPATFLMNLPTLPEPLEYRIIGKHLVLLDTGANIIVDFISNVVP
jgi:hypothetical protein